MRAGHNVGHYVTKETPFKYVSGNIGQENTLSQERGNVYVPVSSKLYTIAKIALITGAVVIAILVFYFMIIVPVKLLKRIASRDFFNRRNVTDLQAMGHFSIGLWFLNNLLPIIIYQLFAGALPKEIYLPYAEVLLDGKMLLIAGLALHLIANAFERGYQLEREMAAKMSNM